MKELELTLTDKYGYFYGNIRIITKQDKLNIDTISRLFKNVIIENWKEPNEFFEDYSENLERAVDLLHNKILTIDSTAKTLFLYDNNDILDIDTVY